MLVQLLQDAWLWIWHGFLSLLGALEAPWDRLLDWLSGLAGDWVKLFWDWINAQLGGVAGGLKIPDWLFSAWQDTMTLAAYFIPIKSMLGIWGTYVGLQRAIRVVRWIIKALPFV